MLKKSLIAAVLLTSFAGSAFASSPSWDYVQVGYDKVDVDETDVNPTGFNVAGSYALNENVFIQARYKTASDDVDGIDLDVDFTTLGLGWKVKANESSDVYAMIALESIGTDASNGIQSASQTETGFGGYVGIKSAIGQNVEVTAEIGYVKIDDFDISEVSFEVQAYYALTKNFSLGAGYKTFDDFDTLSLNARYNF